MQHMYDNYGYNSLYRDFYNYDYSNLKEMEMNTKDFTLKLFGLGSVKARPDIAVAFIGIITENKELSAAQTENAAISQKVIEEIMRLGVDEKDIKTESYSISPEYDFIEGKQVFRNYRVSNNLQIGIKNIEDIGKIIDTAVASGANAVYNVNFDLSNKQLVYKEALILAIKNAISKAKSIEKTMNIAVEYIPVAITEESLENIYSRSELYSMQIPAAVTQIRSGEIEVRAKINAIFNYRKL